MNKLNRQINNLIRQIFYHPKRKEFYMGQIKKTIEYENSLLIKKEQEEQDIFFDVLDKGNKYIYAIQDINNYIKIGVSAAPKKRIQTLQIAHATPLKLISLFKGDYRQEKRIHKHFSKYRKRGEWFEPNKSLLEFLEKKHQFL